LEKVAASIVIALCKFRHFFFRDFGFSEKYTTKVRSVNKIK
jgi:hypothetical protein